MAYCATHRASFSDTEQCPHCEGALVEPYEFDDECAYCGGEGFIENDCFEDTCCCLDPETSHGFRACPTCTKRVTDPR